MGYQERTSGGIKVLVAVLALLITITLIYFDWWWWGSRSDFHDWHPKIGKILWPVKYLALLFWIIAIVWMTNPITKLTFLMKTVNRVLHESKQIVSFLKFFLRISQPSVMFLFPLYIVLSILLGEQHPFTTVPMYSTLSTHAYIFYFKNDSGVLIPTRTFTSISGAQLSHLVYNSAEENLAWVDTFCAEVDTSIAGAVYKAVMETSNIPTQRLLFHRACVTDGVSFGQKTQLLYEPH